MHSTVSKSSPKTLNIVVKTNKIKWSSCRLFCFVSFVVVLFFYFIFYFIFHLFYNSFILFFFFVFFFVFYLLLLCCWFFLLLFFLFVFFVFCCWFFLLLLFVFVFLFVCFLLGGGERGGGVPTLGDLYSLQITLANSLDPD